MEFPLNKNADNPRKFSGGAGGSMQPQKRSEARSETLAKHGETGDERERNTFALSETQRNTSETRRNTNPLCREVFRLRVPPRARADATVVVSFCLRRRGRRPAAPEERNTSGGRNTSAKVFRPQERNTFPAKTPRARSHRDPNPPQPTPGRPCAPWGGGGAKHFRGAKHFHGHGGRAGWGAARQRNTSETRRNRG